MKKLNLVFAILIAFVTFTSCNNSEDIIPDIIISTISPETATIGDIIIINGQNFDVNNTYQVFFNGLEGTVTEVATTYLKVTVPDRAASGEITVSYNSKTINAGTITIVNVFTGNITLLTQQEVDDFGANNYTKVVGNIIIGSDTNLTPESIQNLDALATLTEVTEELGVYENTKLSSLSGLSNLISVGGNLVISYNKILSDLNGLNKLTTVGKNFQISDNPALLNVDVLSNLTLISGELSFSSNENLTSLSGLSNLTSLGGFSLSYSDNVTNLNFLSNITSLTGNLSLQSHITSLEGLNNIKTIGGELDLQHNLITTLNELNSLTSIGGVLNLYANENLLNLDGLDNLTSVEELFIQEANITNIDALSNLTSVVGRINIYACNSLINLDGLNGLTSVGSDIKVKDNSFLTSFCGLSNLIINHNYSNTFTATGNVYNPSKQDITDGNCSN